MSLLRSLGLGGMERLAAAEPRVEYVHVQRPLQRIFAFTRRSIHDVINDPIARREVLGYYKLYRYVQRGMEITELERQWNSLGSLGR